MSRFLAECSTQETWQQDAVVALVFVAMFAFAGFVCWLGSRG